mgnify:CR=1 FL=1
MSNLGKGLFVAKKNDKYGVINAEDETIVDFDFDFIASIMMGDNFIAHESSEYFLIGPDGKEVTKDVFVNVANTPTQRFVTYVDIDALGQLIAKEVELFDPTLSVEELVKSVPGVVPSHTFEYMNTLNTTKQLSKSISADIGYYFDEHLAYEKTHQVTESDGWFSYTRTVSDGYAWNKENKLNSILMKVSIPYELTKKISESAINQLKASGYTAPDENNYMQKKVKGSDISVTVRCSSSPGKVPRVSSN